MDAKIKLLIADEHPVARRGVAALFASEADMQIVGEAENAQSLPDALRSGQPNVVLMDFCLRRAETVEAVNAALREFSEARFLIFTSFEGREDVLSALRAGLWGYLPKTAPSDEILAAVRAVARGERWLSPRLAVKARDAETGPGLTEREREILLRIASGKSNRDIGETLFIAEGTVKFHVNNIFAKLAVNDRTEAVIIGLQRGILRLEEP